MLLFLDLVLRILFLADMELALTVFEAFRTQSTFKLVETTGLVAYTCQSAFAEAISTV